MFKTYRYAQCLSTILVTLAFSPGMPLLLPFCAIFFFLAYWSDKFTLTRGSSVPPQIDEGTAIKACGMMFIAIIFNCAISIWMLGNQEAYPSKMFSADFMTDVNDGLNTIGADSGTLFNLTTCKKSITNRFATEIQIYFKNN